MRGMFTKIRTQIRTSSPKRVCLLHGSIYCYSPNFHKTEKIAEQHALSVSPGPKLRAARGGKEKEVDFRDFKFRASLPEAFAGTGSGFVDQG